MGLLLLFYSFVPAAAVFLFFLATPASSPLLHILSNSCSSGAGDSFALIAQSSFNVQQWLWMDAGVSASCVSWCFFSRARTLK